MSKQASQNDTKKCILFPVILILLLLLSFTSSIAGYILGKNAIPQYGGRIIDTINLDPSKNQNDFAISGTVINKNGELMPGYVIEIHSTVQHTVTDKKGHFFFFHSIEKGKHEIIVKKNGKYLASKFIEIKPTTSKKQFGINYNDKKGFIFEIPVEVLMIEIEIVIKEQDGNNELNISYAGVVQKDGTIIDETGAKPAVNGEKHKTSRGLKVLDDGTVVLQNNDIIFNDSTLIKYNGTVYLSDKTSIKPKTKTEFDNGGSYTPNIHEIVTPGGHIISFKKNESKKETSKIEPKEDEVIIVNNPSGNITVRSEGKNWTQNTLVNLFAGIDKLYPGCSGVYPFEIANTLETDAIFSIEVKDEHKNPIPFKITLRDNNNNKTKADNVIIKSGEVISYVLEWEWPFKGNDKIDTEIGTAENKTHTVTIVIRAEQI